MRNNEERTGPPPRDASTQPPPPASQPEAQGASLNFVVPTEFVELPSKGQFYAEDHPLHNKETVEIRFMTAKEEDLLTSKTLLKKGIAIDRMLESLIVDKRIKINDLLLGDKNALIIASRISGYGADYESRITCPVCGESSKWSFDLNSCTTPSNTGIPEGSDISDTGKGTYIIPLPASTAQVEVGMLTGQDERKMATIAEKKKKHKLPETQLTDQFRMFIRSVNGNSEQATINKFINSMPAKDSRYLRKVYNELAPNVDMTQDFECDFCAAETEVSVPFTAEFFWPK